MRPCSTGYSASNFRAYSSLSVADDCLAGLHPVRVVYASQHGELARTLGIMESLRPECPDGPSPASFALSVLNSTPGIYSIARRDHSPALALSAGEASCWYGLLEAAQVPAGPINTVAEVFQEPQIQAREMQVNVPHPLNPDLQLVEWAFLQHRHENLRHDGGRSWPG